MISIHAVSCSRLAILTVSLHGEEPNSINSSSLSLLRNKLALLNYKSTNMLLFPLKENQLRLSRDLWEHMLLASIAAPLTAALGTVHRQNMARRAAWPSLVTAAPMPGCPAWLDVDLLGLGLRESPQGPRSRAQPYPCGSAKGVGLHRGRVSDNVWAGLVPSVRASPSLCGPGEHLPHLTIWHVRSVWRIWECSSLINSLHCCDGFASWILLIRANWVIVHRDAIVTSSSAVFMYLKSESLFELPFGRTAIKKLFNFCKIHLAVQLGDTRWMHFNT